MQAHSHIYFFICRRSEIKQISESLPEDLRAALERQQVTDRACEAVQRRARVVDALANGLRVVVDCSYGHDGDLHEDKAVSWAIMRIIAAPLMQ